jgi:hypothetical protein
MLLQKLRCPQIGLIQPLSSASLVVYCETEALSDPK